MCMHRLKPAAVQAQGMAGWDSSDGIIFTHYPSQGPPSKSQRHICLFPKAASSYTTMVSMACDSEFWGLMSRRHLAMVCFSGRDKFAAFACSSQEQIVPKTDTSKIKIQIWQIWSISHRQTATCQMLPFHINTFLWQNTGRAGNLPGS